MHIYAYFSIYTFESTPQEDRRYALLWVPFLLFLKRFTWIPGQIILVYFQYLLAKIKLELIKNTLFAISPSKIRMVIIYHKVCIVKTPSNLNLIAKTKYIALNNGSNVNVSAIPADKDITSKCWREETNRAAGILGKAMEWPHNVDSTLLSPTECLAVFSMHSMA